MSELTITPDFDEKTATIEGTASAGETVSVVLKDCASLNTSTLRLRVLFMNKLLAVYPVPVDEGETQDTFTADGDDLTCTLNLCTEQALKVFKHIPEMDVMFILDDIGSSVMQMYFRDFHTLLGWPMDASDTPIDLSGYTDKIAELTAAIADVEDDLEEAVGTINTSLAGKVDKISGKGLSTVDVTSETLAGLVTTTDFNAHVADTDAHILSSERTAWNAKADSSAVALKQDIIVSGNYIFLPNGDDPTLQRYHRAQVVWDSSLDSYVLDVSDTLYTYSNGTFTEA